jgi:hypothetical protein
MRSSHPVAAAVREDETNMSAELDFVDVEATRMRARRQLENAPASPARPAVSHCPPVSRLVQRSSVQASCLALGRPTSCSTRVVREWDDWSRARRPGQSTDAASTTSTRSLQRAGGYGRVRCTDRVFGADWRGLERAHEGEIARSDDGGGGSASRPPTRPTTHDPARSRAIDCLPEGKPMLAEPRY